MNNLSDFNCNDIIMILLLGIILYMIMKKDNEAFITSLKCSKMCKEGTVRKEYGKHNCIMDRWCRNKNQLPKLKDRKWMCGDQPSICKPISRGTWDTDDLGKRQCKIVCK